MRVLVATSRTNGAVATDYDFCVEGELVYMQQPCADDEQDPEHSPCGCGRGFAGTNSHRATTTAEVVECPLSEAEIREAVRSSLEAGGWIDPTRMQPHLAKWIVDETLETIAEVAAHFPVGSVVRRHIWQFFAM